VSDGDIAGADGVQGWKIRKGTLRGFFDRTLLPKYGIHTKRKTGRSSWPLPASLEEFGVFFILTCDAFSANHIGDGDDFVSS